MPVPVRVAEEGFESIGRQLNDAIEILAQRRYFHFSRSVGWRPAVNVYEDETSYYVCAELAGMSREQIDVQVIGHKIGIRGERPAPVPREVRGPRCVLRMEINSGPFAREIELPEQADMNTVEARFDNGFLCIAIGKKDR